MIDIHDRGPLVLSVESAAHWMDQELTGKKPKRSRLSKGHRSRTSIGILYAMVLMCAETLTDGLYRYTSSLREGVNLWTAHAAYSDCTISATRCGYRMEISPLRLLC